jgi:hypothetical protein
VVDLARGRRCEGERADSTVVRARVDLVNPNPNAHRIGREQSFIQDSCGLTLCESIGSNFTVEIDDFEVAGQWA